MDDSIAQFVAITDASSEKARQYLNISDNNLEQAIELFFNTGGADLLDHTQAATPAGTSSQAPPVPPSDTRPGRSARDIVDLGSDDEMEGIESNQGQAASFVPGGANAQLSATEESDEAIARRLQEEMYGEAGMSSTGAAAGDVDAEGYRAPIARTRETLVGPDPYEDPHDAMQAAVMEQLARREQARSRKTNCKSNRPDH